MIAQSPSESRFPTLESLLLTHWSESSWRIIFRAKSYNISRSTGRLIGVDNCEVLKVCVGRLEDVSYESKRAFVVRSEREESTNECSSIDWGL